MPLTGHAPHLCPPKKSEGYTHNNVELFGVGVQYDGTIQWNGERRGNGNFFTGTQPDIHQCKFTITGVPAITRTCKQINFAQAEAQFKIEIVSSRSGTFGFI